MLTIDAVQVCHGCIVLILSYAVDFAVESIYTFLKGLESGILSISLTSFFTWQGKLEYLFFQYFDNSED